MLVKRSTPKGTLGTAVTRGPHALSWFAVVRSAAFAAALAFAFALPWERTLAVAGIGAVGRVLGFFALALALVALFDRGTVRFRPPSVFLVAAATFASWALTSLLWSTEMSLSLVRAITYVQLLAMTWVFWQATTTVRRFESVMQAYVLGCFVMVTAVVVGFLGGTAEGMVRYTAFDANQNYLAQTLVLGIPMAWLLALKRTGWVPWWLNALYLPACMLVLGLAASRGAFVMSLVALSIVPLTLSMVPRGRRSLLIAALLVTMLGAYVVLPEANVARLAETTDRIAAGDLTSRERIWRAGIDAFLEPGNGWLLGTGAGTYAVVVQPRLGQAFASHNAYLSVLVELGLIGILLFGTMLLVTVVPLLSLRSVDRSVLLVLWLALAVAMTSSNWDYQRVTWFTWVLLTARTAWVFSPGARERLDRWRRR
jgi:O-antigen ligase